MQWMGTIRDGKVILDDGAQLPEGTRVEITVVEQEVKEPTLAFMLKLAGTVNDMPPDMAAEHDHYIHGTPKRKGRVT